MAEVLIEGRRLDVMEGLDFSFNYSIADVRDPNKRSTNYSKTIKCPSTKNNDLLFGHIYDVNISNPNNPSDVNIEVNFNPNKKAEARVIQDGVEVMTGVVQLRSITINNGRYDYEVVFIGNLVTFFSEIGKKKLREIDFSDLDHTYDYQTVESSWTNTTGYVYPMIDYGDDSESQNGVQIWRVRQFKPALFVKTIVDKIFDFANFTYESSIFNSAHFAKLIVPFSGEKLYANDAQIASRSFKASLSSPEGSYVSGDFTQLNSDIDYRTLRLDDDSTGNNEDPGDNWSTSTWRYLVPNDGFYSFKVSQKVKLVRTTFTPIRTYDGSLKIHLQILRTDTNLNTTIIGENVLAFQLQNNPQTVIEEIDLSTSCNEQVMFDGDKVQFRFLVNYEELVVQNLSGQLIDPRNIFTDFSMTTESADGEGNASNTLFEGDPLTFQSTVPDITINEFMMSLIKMFNLYIESDNLNDRRVIIESRNDYYSGGIIRDWTKKLSRDQKIEVKPLGLLSAKVYNYKYKSDKDYYNERHETSYQEPYGTRRYEVDNDFLNNNQDVEVEFSATPLNIEGNSDRFVPRIYDNNIDNGASPTDANVRILYYDYLPCTSTWSYISETSVNLQGMNNYPYAGHLDNPITPTLDLCFGIPSELYYQANGYTGTLQYTNANLFNVYHRDYVREVTDKDSKILIGYFYLDAFDIEKLDFRDQILIDNAYWRINKIKDYNPFKDTLTKVELIKVLDIVPQENETFNVGSIGSVGSGASEEIKASNTRLRKQLSQWNSYNGSVNGRYNIVSPSAQNFRVMGDSNYIGDSAKNITITGNNNYVASGLENVIILNSDGQEVYESNTIYQNGVNVTGGEVQSASLVIPSADVLQLYTTPLTIVPAQGAGKAIEVISGSVKVDFNSAVYATNTDILLIENGASYLMAKISSFLSATVSSVRPIEVTSSANVTDTQIIANAALQVSVSNGNPTAGDSDIEVFVLYRVINV